MNTELYYTEKGEGYPLILLHGNGENGEYFARQIEFFSEFYRVIAVDTRGHGKSPRGTASFTISQFADDLKLFMDRLKIEKAHILGFSDGGNIAAVFVMRYPERVDRLILNGANLYSAGVKPTVQIPIILGYHIASLFAKKNPKARANAEMLGLMVNCPNLTAEDLVKIKSRTLVIAGSNDMIKDKHTRLIHENIADSQLVILEGDHFIAQKCHEKFNKAVYEFLIDNR